MTSSTHTSPGLNYNPGALWKTRSGIWSMTQEVKDMWIPFGTIVMLVKYNKTQWTEEAFILWGEDLLYIVDFDIGHTFDMCPAKNKG